MAHQVQSEKQINMKLYLFFIIFVYSFSVYSQEIKTTELDTIRQQGYLIIGTDELGKLSDIAPKFLFIPLKDIERSLESSYIKNSKSNFNDLYIPAPYLYDSDDLLGINIYIKKFVDKNTKIKLNQQTVPIMDLLNKCNNIYRFKNNLGQFIKTFKVIYLDGLWVKLKVSKKRPLPMSASYNETRLNKSEKNYYDYYFLVDTKAISYNLFFNDNTIDIINNK